MTNETATTPTQSATPTLLSSLASALGSGDRESVAEAFGVMAGEALDLAGKAPSEELWQFWLNLHEDFHYRARVFRGVVR